MKLKISDLSLIDKAGITKSLSPNDYVVEEPRKTPGRHHELATLALIGGINVAVAAAAYFFGKRKKNRVEMTVEIEHPNGMRQKVHLILLQDEKDPLDMQISKQLTKALST